MCTDEEKVNQAITNVINKMPNTGQFSTDIKDDIIHLPLKTLVKTICRPLN